MKISLFSKNKLKTTSLRIIVLIVIPILFALICLAISSYNYHKSYTEILKNNCSTSLQSFAEESEQTLKTIISVSNTLGNNNEIRMVLRNKVDAENQEILSNISVAINQFCNNFANIDSVIIINSQNNFVISKSGKRSFDNFFGEQYIYENYSIKYWKSFKFFDSSSYRIISPTLVTENDAVKSIVPIVFRQIGDYRFNNQIVVNVKLDSMLSKGLRHEYTKNSRTYILNKYTGQVFSNDPLKSGISISETDLYRSLVSNGTSFNYNDEQYGKSFVVYHSPSDNLIGYTYYVVIPYSDIKDIQTPFTITTLVIIVISIFLSISLTVYSTSKIISPFQRIATLFNNSAVEDSSNTDIIKYIENATKSIINKNLDLSLALPFAQEKYLINFLNSTDYFIDEHTKDMIRSSLPFTHPYFASVVVQLYPTNNLYQTYNNVEYNNIQSGFYNIIKEMFSEYYNIFFISSEKETLYIIVNLESTEPEVTIESIMQELQTYLKNDMTFVELYIGLGGIHYDLDGLKQSHNEALQNLKIVPKSKEQIIFSPTKQKSSGISYIFTNTDENKLFNLLVSNNVEEAMELIQKSIYQNINIDMRSQKQLYNQILNIIFRVLRIKKIPYDNENKGDLIFIAEILESPVKEIYLIVLQLLNKITAFKPKQTSPSENENIIEYINQNFSNEDICLDSIAAEFDTRVSYVSKLIKDQLGIGFHEYLTNLRITNAKELLAETSKNITEVYKEVGFNSKQTFFRSFKTIVGTTPSEYRKRFG